MRLIKCHIENFGTLNNFDYDFDKDINSICWENGSGKSTFAEFICAMFYGLRNDGKKSYANARKRYMPWNKQSFGGSLTFAVKDKEYQIIRSFGNTAKADEFSLFDVKTGLISNDYSDNIGGELFGIDEESFSRTAYIGQSLIETQVSSDINAKISNLTDNTDDINNYESVDAAFKKFLDNNSASRATGTIKKLTVRLGEIENELNNCDTVEDRFDADFSQISKLQTELRDMERTYETAKDFARNVEYSRVPSEDIKLFEAYKGYLDGDTDEIKSDYVNTRNAVESYKLNSKLRDEQLDDLAACKKRKEAYIKELDIQSKKDKSRKNTGLICMIMGILLLAAFGICAYIYSLTTPLFVIAGCGLIALIFGIVYAFAGKKTGTVSIDFEDDIFAKETKIRSLNDEISANGDLFRHYMDKYGFKPDLKDWDTQFNSLLLNIDKAKRVLASKEKESIAIKDLYEFTLNQRFDLSFNPDNFNEDLFKSKLGNLSLQIQDIKKEIARIDKELRELERRKGELADLEVEKNNIIENLEELTAKYRIIEMTRDYLAQAKNNLISNYTNPIKESMEKYLKLIDKTSDLKLELDAQINVKYEAAGGRRDVETLSAGYKDLTMLILRLALLDAMYEKEKPVIILDDPFINFDDEKVKGGLDFIKEVSKEYQIIYLTCSNARNA